MQDIVQAGSGSPWAFSLGGWQLHLGVCREPTGRAGIEVCTVPPVYVLDGAGAQRALGELMGVVHGAIKRAGGKLPATDAGLAVLLPQVRTWVEDAVRRGVLSWEPAKFELFVCKCASEPVVPTAALAFDQDYPRDCPPVVDHQQEMP